MTPSLSVVVPVHDARDHLAHCLRALAASDLARDQWELIVVDDSSHDFDAHLVESFTNRVIRLEGGAHGPAYARNRGAEAAVAPIVAFVDSDVMVHSDTLRRILAAFDDSDAAAVFGSYDDTPAGSGIVSQYRNLLHHRVHQRSAGEVESFWAGCGAVRKNVFDSVKGFDDTRYRKPEMEDVELGYRLRDAGHRIVLDPRILCTHRKRWTARSMVRSDFAGRGIPWTRLLIERRMLFAPRGLSLGAPELASFMLAAAFVALAVTAVTMRSVSIGIAAAAALLVFVLVNGSLFTWLSRIRGPWFAARAVFLHLLYSVVGVAAVVGGSLLYLVSPRTSPAHYTRSL